MAEERCNDLVLECYSWIRSNEWLSSQNFVTFVTFFLLETAVLSPLRFNREF